MRAIIIFFNVVLLSNICFGQLTVADQMNSTVKDFIKNYLLIGDGLVLDTNKPVLYNNVNIINNNQIGIFNNNDISNNNIPVDTGIVLVTSGINSVKTGTNSTIEGISINNSNAEVETLSWTWKKYVVSNLNLYGSEESDPLNDICLLEFYVIANRYDMEFNYCFASTEYPSFVNTKYNDFFTIVVNGPYELGNEIINYYDANTISYEFKNVSNIPNENKAVMINTVNNGKQQGVDTSHPELFIDNRNKDCTTTGFGGYTVRLSTEKLKVVPSKSYKITIAICNVMDNSYPSALFVERYLMPKDTTIFSHTSDNSKLYYSKTSNNTCKIINNIDGNSYSGKIVIPENVEDYDGNVFTVTAIDDNAFENCNNLTSVTIPKTIEYIGTNAFKGCNNLCTLYYDIPYYQTQELQSLSIRELYVGDNVNSLADELFAFCQKLKFISFGKNITSIGNECFAHCLNIDTLCFNTSQPPTLGNEVFTQMSWIVKIIVPCDVVDNYKNDSYWSEFPNILCVDISVNVLEKNDITLYPNPTSKYLYIKGLEGDKTIIIYDINAKEVYKKYINNSNYIDISHLNAGIYDIVIISQDQTYNLKFVKQ